MFFPIVIFYAVNCSAQNVVLDSLTRDSLLRAGYERCEAILSHEFDTCIDYSDESWSEEKTCYNENGGDSVRISGVHMGCCDYSHKYVYDDGRLIGIISRESSPEKREYSVCYYVGDFVIEATWDREYYLQELRIKEVTLAGSMFIVPPSATIPTLTVPPR